MKILFMGTPEIAAASLRAILAAGHTVCGVFTREDKPVGRKQIITAPPVKQVALAHEIPVFQPKTLRDGAAAQTIAQLAPDVVVVLAYGRILPPEILRIPPLGCLNLHVSLLPQYRGAAPIQWAVIHGKTQTGVTVMQMDEGVDTGDILCVTPVDIGAEETSGELFERMTQIGAQTLLKALEDVVAGRVIAKTQDHTKATLAPTLTKEMACFTFAQEAHTLHNLVRGLNPWPVAYFIHEDKKIKVLRTTLLPEMQGAAGEILSLKPLTVACTTGALVLKEMVPEGSRPMEGSAWAVGKRLVQGAIL